VEGAEKAIADIHSRGKRALIVGGTGFYLKALLFGLWQGAKADPKLRAELEKKTNPELYDALYAKDPESALRMGVNDRYRLIRAAELIALTGKTPSELQAEQPSEPDPRFELWITDRDNDELQDRISQRTRAMLKDGLIEEVKSLAAKYPKARALESVGYHEVIQYLNGISPPGRKVAPGEGGLVAEIELATRQLVKRQRTWFRSQPTAKWFILDRDRKALAQEFNRLYGVSA
jgi:tRNA dimethylallyltransferase